MGGRLKVLHLMLFMTGDKEPYSYNDYTAYNNNVAYFPYVSRHSIIVDGHELFVLHK